MQDFHKKQLIRSKPEKTEKLLLRTEKADKKNHGLGQPNVARAVEALAGTLELKKEDCFLTVVILVL